MPEHLPTDWLGVIGSAMSAGLALFLKYQTGQDVTRAANSMPEDANRRITELEAEIRKIRDCDLTILRDSDTVLKIQVAEIKGDIKSLATLLDQLSVRVSEVHCGVKELLTRTSDKK